MYNTKDLKWEEVKVYAHKRRKNQGEYVSVYDTRLLFYGDFDLAQKYTLMRASGLEIFRLEPSMYGNIKIGDNRKQKAIYSKDLCGILRRAYNVGDDVKIFHLSIRKDATAIVIGEKECEQLHKQGE